jgi:glycerophosphoryl diester phosphodiesterase
MTSRPAIVAHRGASAVHPENTMVAFEHAIALGADAIEFDVQATADGALIVMHDDLLDRTTTGTGPPFTRDLAYIRSLDAGAWFDGRYGSEPVPTLDEVLSLEGIEFELELKTSGAPFLADVVRTVRAHGAIERTEFTSWNLAMLIALKTASPDARIGLFSQRRGGWMTDEVYERSVVAPTPFGSFDIVHTYAGTITESLVDRIHAGSALATGNDAAGADEIRRALEAGADRISSNDVELARMLIDKQS